MGLKVLFKHLKILLLQCFQFSVFNFSKINSIQTDPNSIITIYKRTKENTKWFDQIIGQAVFFSM